MRLIRTPTTWIAVSLLIIVGYLLAEFTLLLSLDSKIGDWLTAISAVLGGLIGAGGAALAVYLTLASQRKDEAEKVEASLRAEVVEFARLAMGPLDILTKIVLPGIRPLGAREAPSLVEFPEPVVFRAVADRLSRLHYGPLLVTFHVRIAEARQMANLYRLSVPKVLMDRGIPYHISKDQARTFTTAWYDICTIARTILRAEQSASQLVEAGRQETLRSLDESIGNAEKELSSNTPPNA